jgi:phosphatidylserine/phosphatidylglycerophosphate/cardiolipin synthase-like enzyme
MKKLIIIALLLLSIFQVSMAQTTILEARGMAVGTVVTVTGIATNGSELGIIRYLQDNTAGIAAYGSMVGTVNRGDNITVTGTLKIYNQLLELDPLTSVVINSSGNPLPDPIVLTPNQISEQYEGKLVKINFVEFNDAGQEFTGNNLYEFSASGQTGYIYVKNGQNLVGTVIPTGFVNLTAICSQFHYSNPNAGYQLLPRDLNDISLTSSIYLTGSLVNTDFTQTTMDFTWTTNVAGTTELFYGPTAEAVTENSISGTGGSTNHSIDLTGLNPGEITWVQAFSVTGSDTARSAIQSFATISNSSGKMISYFNSPVDVSYSNGVDAIYLPSTIDDTLIKYIERAKYTIDFTIYNFNNTGISNISDALIAAADNGIRVRVIGCGTTANMGIDELIGTSVHLLIGPDGDHRTGIMHNKFIVFDAQSEDPNDPLVWTGSTNFTDGQVNLDANNVIIIQDQSLARAYQIEFEEMWGSYGDEPNSANAKFGSAKKNNTPHEFVINGIYTECYFSPSDGVNARIVEVINTANNDLSIATMLITRTEMANAIAARKSAGVAVNVITNAEGGNSTTVNDILSNSLTTHYTFDDVSSGILHHKYMIVDQYAAISDPMVFTGSHNWSAAADNDNDENTLVIHDATLANIYYQQFVKRFVDNMGVLFELTSPPTAVVDTVETVKDQLVIIPVLDNDILQAPVTISIEQQASSGNAYLPFANPNAINYQPATGFLGQDSIVYKIVYNADPTLFASAKVYISVVNDNGIGELNSHSTLNISPNPAKDVFYIHLADNLSGKAQLTIFDLMGNKMINTELVGNEKSIHIDLRKANLKQGLYMVVLEDEKTLLTGRLIICK